MGAIIQLLGQTWHQLTHYQLQQKAQLSMPCLLQLLTTVSMPSAPAAGGAAGPRSSTGSAYIAGSGLRAVIFAANYTKGGGACGLSLTALMLTADMNCDDNNKSWVPYIATCNLPNTTRASAHYTQPVKACVAATCQLTATSSGSCSLPLTSLLPAPGRARTC